GTDVVAIPRDLGQSNLREGDRPTGEATPVSDEQLARRRAGNGKKPSGEQPRAKPREPLKSDPGSKPKPRESAKPAPRAPLERVTAEREAPTPAEGGVRLQD